MTEKTINYTEAQVLQIVEGYKAGETTEALALKVGKTVKSVVAKLVREGVYKSATKATKARTTKADLINKIAQELNLEVTQLESFEKATFAALEALATKVCFTQEQVE